MKIFDTGRTLLATLGYPLFEPVANPAGPACYRSIPWGGGCALTLAAHSVLRFLAGAYLVQMFHYPSMTDA